jgi:4-alpha-glucanotransferase
LSSFAGNELLISSDRLIEDGLLRATDCEANSLPSAAIEYGALIPYKRRMLEKAWGNSRTGALAGLQADFEQFCDTHRLWLEDCTLFRGLTPRMGGRAV